MMLGIERRCFGISQHASLPKVVYTRVKLLEIVPTPLRIDLLLWNKAPEGPSDGNQIVPGVVEVCGSLTAVKTGESREERISALYYLTGTLSTFGRAKP